MKLENTDHHDTKIFCFKNTHPLANIPECEKLICWWRNGKKNTWDSHWEFNTWEFTPHVWGCRCSTPGGLPHTSSGKPHIKKLAKKTQTNKWRGNYGPDKLQ